MSIYKTTLFSGVDAQGTPLVRVIHPGPASGREKLAHFAFRYHPKVEAFIQKLVPKKGMLYVFVNALGVGEYYGPNLNGDFFPEKEVLRGGGYGYETYRDCGVYREHKNGRHGGVPFGKVVLAVYNERMKRVELVLCIDRQLAAEQGHQDLIDALDRGEHPPVSMGMLVPYDVCSDPACGRKAVTKQDYCEHMRCRVGAVDPDTLVHYSLINVYIKHHDISFVKVPGSTLGLTLEKVARKSAPVPLYRAKREVLTPLRKEVLSKLKAVASEASKYDMVTGTLPYGTIVRMARTHHRQAIPELTGAGVLLTPLEFQTLLLEIKGFSELAATLYERALCFAPSQSLTVFEPDPRLFDGVCNSAQTAQVFQASP
jgi:hypothetical protein